MRKWLQILPMFVIIRLARKKCEKFIFQGTNWHLAFADVLIKAKE